MALTALSRDTWSVIVGITHAEVKKNRAGSLVDDEASNR